LCNPYSNRLLNGRLKKNRIDETALRSLSGISAQQDTSGSVCPTKVARRGAEAGGWQKDLPFYQTLNALAHLDLPQADKQLKKAFKRLSEDQNSDGTWSRSEPEWNTFLRTSVKIHRKTDNRRNTYGYQKDSMAHRFFRKCGSGPSTGHFTG